MKTDNLYIASLRVVIKRVNLNAFKQKRTHKHLKYVLVKSDDMQKFIDIKTNEEYAKGFELNDRGIVLKYCYPFNDMIGNDKEKISKRKALKLFNERVNEWRSKQ